MPPSHLAADHNATPLSNFECQRCIAWATGGAPIVTIAAAVASLPPLLPRIAMPLPGFFFSGGSDPCFDVRRGVWKVVGSPLRVQGVRTPLLPPFLRHL